MGRLNVNVNVNARNGTEWLTAARYNTMVYAKLLNPDQFPSAWTTPEQEKRYLVAQERVNAVRFREYWDAELRASVYLNEFIAGNKDWLKDWLEKPDEGIRDLHEKLRMNKGQQLREVLEISDEREERHAEIIDQHEAEGVIRYWLGMLMIDPASAPATYQLIRVARRVGEVVVMCLKDAFAEPRPSQVCPAIVPMIDPPNTPSFPSGHALQSHLIATCLWAARRVGVQQGMLRELSERIAENRVVAGLHYPLDNEAGFFAADLCFERLRRGAKFTELLAAAQAESYVEWNPAARPVPQAPDPEWQPIPEGQL